MSLNYLEYPLSDGYLHHWLVSPAYSVAGPDARPSDWLEACLNFMSEPLPFESDPVDRQTFQAGGGEQRWVYARSTPDHFVGNSLDSSRWQVVQAMAYTQIKTQAALQVMATLTSNTLAELWLNGKLIWAAEEFPADRIASFTFPLDLAEGENDLLIRLTDAGQAGLTLQAAIHLAGFTSPEVIQTLIPTELARPDRHYRLEKLLDYAYLEDVVDYRGQHFNVRWAEGLDELAHLTYEVQDADGRIYVTGNLDSDEVTNVGQEYRMREQTYWVTLRATDAEYYPGKLRHVRRMPIHVLDVYYADAPYGNFQTRQLEALKHASQYETSLYAQIARMQLGDWANVDADAIFAAIERVHACDADGVSELLALLGMAMRYGGQEGFPVTINPALKAAVTEFDFDGSVFTQGEELVLLAAQRLAAQHYPLAEIDPSEETILNLLGECGRNGFMAWDSPQDFALLLTAASYLTSLAGHEAIADLSAVLIDKILFSMAVNSYKGAFGSSHGESGALDVKSAQLEPTSGVMRMMWGTGVFNQHLSAVIGLACSTYEFPVFIGQIANDLSQEMWNRERHGLADGEVNKVSYRTADYLLASAQDYKPGQRGESEHIWQATFGPDAQVFVNHPASFSESEGSAPGFWRGNDFLPRVAQWKDCLISVHNADESAWLDFTHAYFPTYQFDEYLIEDGWAFARKGDGYLAITARAGLDLIQVAPDGFRELRAPGRRQVWVCQMGRASQDGDFAGFQDKIRAMTLNWDDLSVDALTPRGERLTFGWDQPLTVNGQMQSLSDFPHIDNPYCQAEYPANSLEISFQGLVMRLSFE